MQRNTRCKPLLFSLDQYITTKDKVCYRLKHHIQNQDNPEGIIRDSIVHKIQLSRRQLETILQINGAQFKYMHKLKSIIIPSIGTSILNLKDFKHAKCLDATYLKYTPIIEKSFTKSLTSIGKNLKQVHLRLDNFIQLTRDECEIYHLAMVTQLYHFVNIECLGIRFLMLDSEVSEAFAISLAKMKKLQSIRIELNDIMIDSTEHIKLSKALGTLEQLVSLDFVFSGLVDNQLQQHSSDQEADSSQLFFFDFISNLKNLVYLKFTIYKGISNESTLKLSKAIQPLKCKLSSLYLAFYKAFDDPSTIQQFFQGLENFEKLKTLNFQSNGIEFDFPAIEALSKVTKSPSFECLYYRVSKLNLDPQEQELFLESINPKLKQLDLQLTNEENDIKYVYKGLTNFMELEYLRIVVQHVASAPSMDILINSLPESLDSLRKFSIELHRCRVSDAAVEKLSNKLKNYSNLTNISLKLTTNNLSNLGLKSCIDLLEYFRNQLKFVYLNMLGNSYFTREFKESQKKMLKQMFRSLIKFDKFEQYL